MTTIVANKEGMASDSQATNTATKTSVQKFWRIRGWLVGAAGTYSDIVEMIDELKAKKDMTPVEILKKISFGKKDCSLLLLGPNGQLYESESGGTPWKVSEGFASIGTGAQGAMCLLHAGYGLRDTINIVKKVDPNTGGRTVTRKLK